MNPKKKKTGDCVIRAIAKATGLSWDEIFKELSDLGFKIKMMPNNDKTFQMWLKQNGWTKQKMPRYSDNTRYTVQEFIDELDVQGMVIIRVARHLTCVNMDEKVLHDTWNCSYKSVGNYWTKEKI